MTWATTGIYRKQDTSHQFNSSLIDCLFAAEDIKDNYVEETEVSTLETRADPPFVLQKPVSRVKLGTRIDSLQVPCLQYRNSIQFTNNKRSVLVKMGGKSHSKDSFVIPTGEESIRLIRTLFSRWKKENWLHPGLQEVQPTGGEEVHVREEFTSRGPHAGEGGEINWFGLKRLQFFIYFSLNLLTVKLVCWSKNLKALNDEQRHHVCEDPCSVGYALQICRADEHPYAFQVTVI